MEQQFEIKNSEEALILVFTLAEVVKEAKKNDNKIDLMDAPLLMKIIPVLGPAITDAKLIPSELKDLSSEEAEKLQALILSRFGQLVEKEKLVEQVNLGLKAAVAVYAFIQSVK